MTTLIIQGYHNDFARKRGVAAVVWADDPEKNLAVAIPFNCAADQIKGEVAKAILALAQELKTAAIELP